MSCLDPLVRIVKPFDFEKRVFPFLTFHERELAKDALQLFKYCRNKKEYAACGSAKSPKLQFIAELLERFSYRRDFFIMDLSCGQCSECKLERSRQFAVRAVLEQAMHPDDSCWFVTLTYDEQHVPRCNVLDNDGEILSLMTLAPKDLDKFQKDLRAYYDYHFQHQGIRYFACGEYGDLYKRPHYHYLFFNLPIPDLTFFKKKNGYSLYVSPLLQDLWKKGDVLIGSLCFESAAYVARYTLKKRDKKEIMLESSLLSDEEYQVISALGNPSNTVYPEFQRFSNRPGIGGLYYEQYRDQLLRDGTVSIKHGERAVTVTIPKYFNYKFLQEVELEFMSEDEETLLDQLLTHRKQRVKALNFQVLQTGRTAREVSADRVAAEAARPPRDPHYIPPGS